MKGILFILFVCSSLFAQDNFNKNFNDKTLRFDFYHVGNSESEQIVFDELIEEPIWGGPKINLIDTLNLGAYKVALLNGENEIIYSKGFSTLFKEWQATREAKELTRAYSGAIIFPYPKRNVTLKLYSRNKENNFEEIYSLNIDPTNYFIRKGNDEKYETDKIKYSGNPSEKYDIAFIPEGYTADEMDKFISDCNLLTNYLFEYAPFDQLESEFNFWAIKAPSQESICDIPADSIWGNTLLNSSYYTFDSERYLMTEDYQKVCDVASNAPYDQIYILANSKKYGGGAIFNFYSLTVTNDPKFKEIFIHELGHGLAGLADEYGYDNSFENFYPKGVEPWEKNITTLNNFSSKWENDIDSSIPVPTPDEQKYEDIIGVFEGGGYVAKGVYRPTHNSIMRTLEAKEFNKPSKQAIREVILFYSK
ncbi:MAG: IgA Peptidase M64 [Bacteroidetes bacterium]|nr:IgA Peptidase M64 [Bacteroidota bacterium]MBU1113845.1 IgA Peptidase M64 [Bacteroidota bacterium]MBU1799663.1 IgA Peptidase M64 [Bacteroidota bacterium]